MDTPDANRTQLREIVATIEGQLAGGGPQPSDRLRSSWGRLVGLLALGPEPEVRACPHCGRMGMRAATRCGFCWSELLPV